MRLLDLFCGSGGSAVGYHRAGFDVVGVDIEPRPRYPFAFVRADALTFPLAGFDAVTASPPCHDHSAIRTVTGRPHGTGWMLAATLERFAAEATVPWVVENVVGADMPAPVLLGGCMFDLVDTDDDGQAVFLKRHRLFAASFPLTGPGPCRCAEHRAAGRRVVGVYGHGGPSKARGYKPTVALARRIMGVDWTTRDQLSQAIPPVYTEFVGRQLAAHLTGARGPQEATCGR